MQCTLLWVTVLSRYTGAFFMEPRLHFLCSGKQGGCTLSLVARQVMIYPSRRRTSVLKHDLVTNRSLEEDRVEERIELSND